jgi:Fic family protein
MERKIKLYTSPAAMEPLFPDDPSGRLEKLSISLIEKANRLSESLHVETRMAIADFLRPMNSYYSNLIEGHDTHPIDISKALKNDFSEDKAKRDLQLEAKAHIAVMGHLSSNFTAGNSNKPYSSALLKEIHKKFYDHLPQSFKIVLSREGESLEVIPGKFRTCEVEVGTHIAPAFEALDGFIQTFEAVYDNQSPLNNSKIKRIIGIAASHHRLAWIHPFLDGNGRVVRLFSDVCFRSEELHADGLWSISRGLARNNKDYKATLANADLERYNDYDGRGNLSNKFLVEFCEFFLSTAIDQIDFMFKVLDPENMLKRISGFVDLMVMNGKMKPEAKYILMDVFLRGKLSKTDAMRITNLSDKTLKNLTDSLIEMDLLSSKKEGISMYFYPKYPILFSPMLFPGLYPPDKEIDMFGML